MENQPLLRVQYGLQIQYNLYRIRRSAYPLSSLKKIKKKMPLYEHLLRTLHPPAGGRGELSETEQEKVSSTPSARNEVHLQGLKEQR